MSKPPKVEMNVRAEFNRLQDEIRVVMAKAYNELGVVPKRENILLVLNYSWFARVVNHPEIYELNQYVSDYRNGRALWLSGCKVVITEDPELTESFSIYIK